MPFLDNFPVTTFQYDANNEIVVRDFIRSVQINGPFFTQDALFDTYYMSDGEKIENISYNYYGTSEYHWVIMYINGIFNPRKQCPQTEEYMRNICPDIYGNVDSIHHYEKTDGSGEWVDKFTKPSIPITNIQFMISQNELKRPIKLLKRQYLSYFLNQYENAINS